MNLLVFLALLVSGISSKHYVDANYVSHPHPAKKFNIVTQPGKDATDSMMVMMKGRDGAAGKDGTQGAPGLPGPPGQVGPPGLKGTQGICSKEQGVVTPQVSVIQGYPGNPGTPRGSLVKKSSIFSDGSDTPKTKHVPKKSVHHSTGRNHHGAHKS